MQVEGNVVQQLHPGQIGVTARGRRFVLGAVDVAFSGPGIEKNLSA
jgi:hypothetical protein